MAAERFRRHPVQTYLTLAGFIVGTSSIILVVSLGLTGRSYVMAQIEGVGSHLVWANYRGTVTSGVSHGEDDFINESDLEAVAARTDLFSGVTGLVTVRGSVTVQSQVKTLTRSARWRITFRCGKTCAFSGVDSWMRTTFWNDRASA